MPASGADHSERLSARSGPHATPASEPDYSDRTDDDLACSLVELHRVEMAVHTQVLRIVAEVVKRGRWDEDGATSAEQWLATRLLVALSTARDWIRQAAVLLDLPHCAAAMDEGRLSHDQLAQVSRMAGPDVDEQLAAAAPYATVPELKAAARAESGPPIEIAEAEVHASRYVRVSHERGATFIRAKLTAADGAEVITALSGLAKAALPDPETGAFPNLAARQADAMVELAARVNGEQATSRHHQVVVHVDGAVLTAGGSGVAETEGGERISAECARRLACETDWLVVADDLEHGGHLGFGRHERRASTFLSRLILERDRGCRFPGCGRTHWLNDHHILYWSAGGTTDVDNLVKLCWTHHQFVHERRWTIAMDEDATVVFTSPTGATFVSKAPPLSPLVRSRIFGQRQRSGGRRERLAADHAGCGDPDHPGTCPGLLGAPRPGARRRDGPPPGDPGVFGSGGGGDPGAGGRGAAASGHGDGDGNGNPGIGDPGPTLDAA